MPDGFIVRCRFAAGSKQQTDIIIRQPTLAEANDTREALVSTYMRSRTRAHVSIEREE